MVRWNEKFERNEVNLTKAIYGNNLNKSITAITAIKCTLYTMHSLKQTGKKKTISTPQRTA